MRVFKTKNFTRFARKESLSDRALCDAVERAARGLVDADLGSGLIKQRVGRADQGRSGGYRTIIAWRSGERSIFIFGFAKSARDNIGAADLEDLKGLASLLLGYGPADLDKAVREKVLVEVSCHDDEA